LLEPLAQRLVLAHPKKLRVIAESTRKSDKLDAQVLAEFLAPGMIPEAHRPSPRQRQHRLLVRQRYFVRRRAAAVKNKIRHLLAEHNADRRDLFRNEGLAYLAQIELPVVERTVLRQLLATWRHHEGQRAALDKALRAFAAKGPAAEREARAVLESIPYVGPVTVDVVLSELGDVGRRPSSNDREPAGDLPPPRAQGMCGRRGTAPGRVPAEMGQIDRRRRRRGCAADFCLRIPCTDRLTNPSP
jgi:transposase